MSEKSVNLSKEVKRSDGTVAAIMYTTLKGDGSTPVIMTTGGPHGMQNIIGYNDDGTVIISHEDDQLIATAQQSFMAEAIKEQKKLCIENGVDPDLVNILNAEKKVNVSE